MIGPRHDCAPTTANGCSPPACRATAGGVLLIAVWLGLFAGLVEAGYLAYVRYGMGRMTFLPDASFWMAPVTHVVAYTLAVVPLFLFVRRSSGGVLLTFAVAWCGALAWLSVLALVPGLSGFAHVVLALGLAAGIGRIFDRFRDKALSALGRTAPWMAGAVVMIALGQQAYDWPGSAGENRAARQVPDSRPNVLLIDLDTLRADALAPYGGSPDDAPFLSQLAMQSLVFDRAYATAPWTLPSTASMFTGRFPGELSTSWDTPLDDAEPTLAEVLSRAGYSTAGFVANTRYCSRETGLARGFEHYEDYTFHPAQFILSTELGRRFMTSDLAPLVGIYNDPARVSAEDVNRRFLDWLSAAPDRPFFAFLNYFDVHHPYVPPAPFARNAPADTRQRKLLLHWWWVHKEHVHEDEAEWQRASYLDCLRYLDSQLQALFRELEQRSILENTIVVITADHGEHFGEHGLYLHGNSLYEPLVHVPLLVYFPDRFCEGERCTQAVSLAALPSTICDVAGLGEGQPFPGPSLMKVWKSGVGSGSETAAAGPVRMQVGGPPGGPLPCQGHSPVARGAMEAVIVGHRKRIRHADGREEIYDLASDPAEEHNLAGDAP